MCKFVFSFFQFSRDVCKELNMSEKLLGHWRESHFSSMSTLTLLWKRVRIFDKIKIRESTILDYFWSFKKEKKMAFVELKVWGLNRTWDNCIWLRSRMSNCKYILNFKSLIFNIWAVGRLLFHYRHNEWLPKRNVFKTETNAINSAGISSVFFFSYYIRIFYLFLFFYQTLTEVTRYAMDLSNVIFL